MARLWLITIAILLVGVLADDEAGLSAAVLAAALVTANLAGEALTRAPRAGEAEERAMSRKAKIFLALGLYFGITILLVIIAGNEGKNEEFQPQNEFLLDPWINLDLGFADMSINKAVLYLFLAAAATIGVMT